MLILIGLCMPLVLFPFSSGYNPRLGFLWSIKKMDLVLWWEEPAAPAPEAAPGRYVFEDEMAKEPGREPLCIVFPYKYIFSIGIILIFSGIGIFILSKPDKIE